jgi:hypothetical protein
MTLRRHPFTWTDGGEGTNDTDQIPMTLSFDFEDSPAIFLVMEGHPLNQPRQ